MFSVHRDINTAAIGRGSIWGGCQREWLRLCMMWGEWGAAPYRPLPQVLSEAPVQYLHVRTTVMNPPVNGCTSGLIHKSLRTSYTTQYRVAELQSSRDCCVLAARRGQTMELTSSEREVSRLESVQLRLEPSTVTFVTLTNN